MTTADFNADGNADLVVANYLTGDADVFLGDGTGQFALSETVTLAPRHVYAAGGSFLVTLTVTDDDGATDVDTMTVTTAGPTQVQVDRIVYDVHTGSVDPQRSTIAAVRVYFTGWIPTVRNTAFTVIRSGLGPVSLQPATVDEIGGKTVATLRFSPAVSTYRRAADRALVDGAYRLAINGDFLLDAFDGRSAGRMDDFDRLFGDSDADGDVDGSDLERIRRVMAGDSRYAAYRSAFDYDGDGRVSASDNRQFRLRYGRRLP